MGLSRTAIIAEARAWIGTPYRHQASAKGAGADCLGLVRGLWRALIGPEPELPPAYSPDWAEAGPETLKAAAERWLVPRPLAAREPGDVLLFRMGPSAPARHAAILVEDERIIHAYWGRAVLESRFGRWWAERATAAFSFPGADPWPS